MKRFRFRLEAVLRHRETIEGLREQDFARAAGEVDAIRLRREKLEQEFAATVAGRPGSASGERFDTTRITDRERYLETIQAAIAIQVRREEAAKMVLEAVRLDLVAARQAREAVSHLRDKELLAHLAEARRVEQIALDEIATTQHNRKTDGVGL